MVFFSVLFWYFLFSLPLTAQTDSSLVSELRTLVETPAVPGYEYGLAQKIIAAVPKLRSQTDNLGDVIFTVGSGSPHRLLAAPMDEPGYVVSDITSEGYLRLQRLPQGGALPLFNELYSAQPVKVETRSAKWIDGSVAALSIHLASGRRNPPDPDDIDNMYIDLGAQNAAQVHAAGVDLLSPMAIERKLYELGGGHLTSAAIGDRFGDAALVDFLRHLNPVKIHGTLTVAFVAQQWTGSRGLERVLNSVKPEELIYVGRFTRSFVPPRAAQGQAESHKPARQPGSGVLFAEESNGATSNDLATELQQLAQKDQIGTATDFSGPLLPRGYAAPPPLPARNVHIGIATAWPSTPAETIDGHDLAQLESLLTAYLQGEPTHEQIAAAPMLPKPALVARPTTPPTPEAALKALIESYGVSGGHEGPTRETVARLLPGWAKPQTDSAGNLILHWGNAEKPRVLVVAHMDEIGYEVHAIRPDGTIELVNKGGGTSAFFMGHPVFVHTADGIRPGALELPEGWDEPNFRWPRGFLAPALLDVGAHNPDEVAQLGIKTGDWVTIPKTYRNLLNRRASARSLDDRVGCAALVSAVWQLGQSVPNRDVTFVWSTSEELGLLGAAEVAKRLGEQGHAPQFVFAVDTFVSSDSPLESHRFGDATLGDGFVVRAVDNSNVVPLPDVEKVVAMSHRDRIPVQYGVTGGGNDGSAFLRYGSTDVALGWPLRYSHSPAEVIDTRDLDALSKIIAAVARGW
ncbi:MAG TPA: M20/M25/M40 family metallo-hydrolase [Terriglobales bacterium]|nr:M20/M25/M40 family metallo-hydrolase [Terriglobales bacterium]